MVAACRTGPGLADAGADLFSLRPSSISRMQAALLACVGAAAAGDRHADFEDRAFGAGTRGGAITLTAAGAIWLVPTCLGVEGCTTCCGPCGGDPIAADLSGQRRLPQLVDGTNLPASPAEMTAYHDRLLSWGKGRLLWHHAGPYQGRADGQRAGRPIKHARAAV